MPLLCKFCGFDLERYKIDLSLRKEDFITKDTYSEKYTLHCPLCGEGFEITLSQLGIAVLPKEEVGYRTYELIRWADAKSKGFILIGNMRIQIESKTLNPSDIIYKMVPAFRNKDGKVIVPTLPVRWDFFSLVDIESIAQGKNWEEGHIEGGMYRAKVPLRGRKEPYEVSLRVMPAKVGDPPASPERDAFEGVSLSVWPDVPVRDWRFFRIALKDNSEGKVFFDERRPVRILYSVHNQFREAVYKDNGGRSVFAVTEDGRPEWVAIEFPDVGGGLFRVFDDQIEQDYSEKILEMAIDLGTSNTCVAFSLQGLQSPKTITVSDLHKSVFYPRMDQVVKRVSSPDMSAPIKGFGVMGDLLPSEILTPLVDMKLYASLDDADKWIPFRDYTIPTNGIEVDYEEFRYVIAEFKLPVRPGSKITPQQRRILYQKYLEALLLIECAHVASGKLDTNPVKTIQVLYAYPGAFGDEYLKEIKPLWDDACKRVSEWTGMRIIPLHDAVKEEAQAAGCNVETGADGFRVYVDMGGGTTQIAIFCQSQVDSSTYPVFISSIAYAGGVVMKAFAGDGPKPATCLQPGITSESLRRQIRQCKGIADLVGDARLFNPHRRALRTRRVNMYFNYVLEYIARLVAGAIINGDYLTYVRGKPGRSEAYPKVFTVEIVMLGNGWGFLSAGENLTPTIFSQTISKRIKTILNQEPYADQLKDSTGLSIKSLEFAIVMRELRGVHPKAAIAFGLLKSQNVGQHKVTMTRTIVGHSTVLNDTVIIPWWKVVSRKIEETQFGITTTEGMAEQEEAIKVTPYTSLSWTDDTPPLYPIELGIQGPNAFDPALRETGGLLHRKLLPPENGNWLRASPFEVMMEEIFAKYIPMEGS